MRLIGHLSDEAHARTFGDYLLVRGIENQVEHEKPDGWGIWIWDEDRITEATLILGQFRSKPEAPEYRDEAKAASDVRAQREKDEATYRKKLRVGRQLFKPLAGYGVGPLTIILIAASIGVFLLSRLGTQSEPIRALFITDYWMTGDEGTGQGMLPEIRHGQLWRLFTPALIHLNLLHIFFNMWWLLDLGSMIEARQKSGYFAMLVLVIAAVSNLAQFWFGHAPFGGMSGVVYGLLGYIWLRGKFDPGSGLFLHQSTVRMMLIWLVVCFTGLVGSIANAAHVAGLIVGMAWGWLSSLRNS
jgi:GlpG protein